MNDEIEKQIKKNIWPNQRDFNNQRTKLQKKKESENLSGKDTTLNEGQPGQEINLLEVQEIVVINVKRRWRGIKLIVN
jgi:hypothetical protein